MKSFNDEKSPDSPTLLTIISLTIIFNSSFSLSSHLHISTNYQHLPLI